MKVKVIVTCLVLALAIVLFLLIKGFFERRPAGHPPPDSPNILLITIDTTRMDHLSCYGYERKTSPNLDLLAEEGQCFHNSFAVSSWTLPTHASLFTGLYPATHGAHYSERGEVSLEQALKDQKKNTGGVFLADRLPEEAVTLAEVMKAAGYRTGGIGSGPWLKPVFGLDQGFDFYDCRVRSTQGRRADEVNALALPFIRRYADEPFFLFLNYFDPHDPYEPPPDFTFKFFPRSRAQDARRDPAARIEFMIARYDAEIFFMDLQIGDIINELKDLNLYDKTCIIVVGDHGEHLGEHDLWKHGHSLFEEVIKSPLIIKWPEGWAPVPSAADSCQHVDLMPTLLNRLNIDPPAPYEGGCLGELNRPIVCELYKNIGQVKREGPRFDRNLTAIYDGGYKLILSSKNNDPDAGLYDLQKDPAETLDLSADREHVVTALKTRLDQWRASLQEPLVPVKVETVDPRTLDQLKALGYAD